MADPMSRPLKHCNAQFCVQQTSCFSKSICAIHTLQIHCQIIFPNNTSRIETILLHVLRGLTPGLTIFSEPTFPSIVPSCLVGYRLKRKVGILFVYFLCR